MKKLLLISLLLILTNFVNSQEHLGNRFGIHAGIYVPNDEFLEVYDNGYGASLSGRFHISQKFSITADIGLYSFQKKFDSLGVDQAGVLGFGDNFIETLKAFGLQDYKIEVPSGHLMPVNIGVEYTILNKKIRPYIGANLGLYAVHTKSVLFNFNEILANLPGTSLPPIPGNGFGNVEFDATDLNFGGGVNLGCSYAVSDRVLLDVSGKYHFLIAPDKDGAVRFVNINLGAFYLF